MVCGVLLAGVIPAFAQAAAEVPVVEKLVATNCKVSTCGQETIEGFKEPKASISPGEANTEGETQAGGRVPFGVTDFKVLTIPGGKYSNGTVVPTLRVAHIRTDVAAGLATDPFAVERCSVAEFGKEAVPGTGLFEAPTGKCGEAEIGEQTATVYAGPPAEGGAGDQELSGTVYNLVAPEGEHVANGSRLASLYGVALELPTFLSGALLKGGFEKAEKEGAVPGENGFPSLAVQKFLEEQEYDVHTLIKGNVEWGKEARGTNAGDFHDYFEIEVNPELPLVRSRLVFDGNIGEGDFITNPTSCEGFPTTSIKVRDAEGVESPAKTFESPVTLTGCPLEFSPGFKLESASMVTEQPNEFEAIASEEHEPEETDVSQVKSASFTLPEGMTLNPSAAKDLQACTEGQAHQDGTVFDEAFGVACPAASKIGVVSLEVPTLPPGSLKGDVYLGAPESGTITGTPYKIYVVANSAEFGVSVRLLGETIPDEATGQVTTYFNNPPAQPFTKLSIKFERGVLAPIANPLLCGTPQGSASFKPNSAPSATHTDAFGVNITGCASTPPPFNPAQSTAVSNGNGGASTAFTFNLGRNDGEQYVGSVKTTLPPGLVGKIPAAEQCSAAAAASETTPCPAGSQIGTATVLAGSGSTPFSFSGPVYLTETVKGAPYGLSIKVPAIAGPFNLGTVVTQATIKVDPTTAQVTVESTLPTIRKGIPLRIRNISVAVNKPGFMINPTNCGKLATVSTVGGFASLAAGGATATKSLETPFQVANCSALKFKPVFKASTSSKTSRVNGASLTTTITQPGGQSNIKSVKVQLPRQLPSRLTTLHKACTDAVFAVDPYKCPSGSFVGGASVTTPTLPGKLTGSAILVSHAGAAFPDLDLVLESTSHVRVILTGNTDIKKGITTTTFASTPDVPVTSVTVKLPVGSHSALGAFGNLCAQPLVMPTTIVGQNGATIKQNTIISVAGCGVRIVGHKVIGNTAYITVRTFAAGRISGSGSGLKTVYRHLSRAYKTVSLKVPLSSRGNARSRPAKIKLRVGFVPKKKGAHSASTVTVTFR
jgi:hypothetical protein